MLLRVPQKVRHDGVGTEALFRSAWGRGPRNLETGRTNPVAPSVPPLVVGVLRRNAPPPETPMESRAGCLPSCGDGVLELLVRRAGVGVRAPLMYIPP